MGFSTPSHVETTAPAPPQGGAGAVISALAGLTACWLAAGSAGLFAHPLRRVLTALLLLASALAIARWQPRPWRSGFKPLAQLVAVVALLAAPYGVLHLLACALTLAWLAAGRAGESSPVLRAAAPAALVFALYQFAVSLIPWGWWFADFLAQGISRAVSALSPWPLSVGPTFAGLDYLVLSLAFCLLLIRRLTAPNKRSLALRWAGVIILAHLVYLFLLASFPKWRAWLPDIEVKSQFPGLPGKAKPLGDVVLWQLPLLGLLLHLPVIALAAWGIGRPTIRTDQVGSVRSSSAPYPAHPWLQLRRWFTVPTVAALALALAVPALALFQPERLSLQGRKIVVYEKGFLNWLKPEHGQYGRLTVGMYGMWPTFFEHYGARCVISPDLSAKDLDGADLLVLIFPNKPWEPGQLERIQNHVARGGALLVLGEHTVREKDGGNRFNEVLAPTAMRVAFDSAMFAVGGWLHSYQALAHPAALGIRDDRNQFGAVIGASVQARLPARPLLIGRWGWNDPGDASNDETKGGSMMGNQKYDAGERLGDVLLAAEQRWGRGRVVVFGDTSGFTNGILYGSHPYVAALMAALCQGVEFAGWRHLLALVGLIGLGFLAVRGLPRWFQRLLRAVGAWPIVAQVSNLPYRRLPVGRAPVESQGTADSKSAIQQTGSLRYEASPPMECEATGSTPRRIAFVALALGLATWTSAAWTARMANLLPDGRKAGPNLLAYIDATHLERASAESWRPTGLGGLQLTLMRSGYLVLALPEFTEARLERAGLVFCGAPGRPFSPRERRAVRRFVENGGIFILTAGWPESAASRSLLADFGFYIGNRGAVEGFGPEPKPFGHFKAPYYNGGDYMAYVRFHAGWSVECAESDVQPLAYGPRNPLTGADPMVIAMRRIGRGKFIVVADTYFASCQNLENEDGSPFEGMRENADFWRWLLTYLNDQPIWTPPKPAVHRHAAPHQHATPEEVPAPEEESAPQLETAPQPESAPQAETSAANRSADLQSAVSRISNPQTAALPTGSRRSSRLETCATERSADWQSAVSRIGNPRATADHGG